MRFLSLFSGIEAASEAWAPLGWECAGVAEIDPFACAVPAHRHPTVKNLGDITKITEMQIAALGHIDLIVFGSPCQDLSVAGKQKGLSGERLQGFPDGHTQIPWRNKPADQCPDGPRYKALGNSMAVPVMRWIGQKIDVALLFQE